MCKLCAIQSLGSILHLWMWTIFEPALSHQRYQWATTSPIFSNCRMEPPPPNLNYFRYNSWQTNHIRRGWWGGGGQLMTAVLHTLVQTCSYSLALLYTYKKDKDRRESKGRRCWLGGQLECRTNHLAAIGWYEQKFSGEPPFWYRVVVRYCVNPGLGTAFFSVRYVPFFSVL